VDGHGFRMVGRSVCALLALAAMPLLAEPPPPSGKPDPHQGQPGSPGGENGRPPFKRFMSEQFPGPDDGGEMRAERMMQLAFTPPETLDKAFEKWPKWQEMPPEKKKAFIDQIQEFRQNMRKFALAEAVKMKLSIPADKEDAFVKAFWMQRVQVEKALHREMEPRRKQLMEEAEKSLQKEFSPHPEPVKAPVKAP
jgi:hypothetical protein